MKYLFLVFLVCPTLLFSQKMEADSSVISQKTDPVYQFSAKKLIIPSVLVSYGILSLMSDDLKKLNQSTRYESMEHILPGAKIDNYTQYVPAIAVYGLNLVGVKGKHNFKDRTIIYITSQLLSAAIVLPTKQLVGEERPDGSSKTSFPSGHTATAFSSAHFMFREYNETNFWLSISGYPIAAMTGIYRVFNDKHWVGDVIAGAGIGILSTEMAYWLFPTISKWFTGKKNQSSLVILPTYQTKQFGLGIIKIF
ncbi:MULTISPECIES: phosphatase PAP2 family protein [Sphingobacterium]|mgnify:CR=1 FL=1|uniref:phosphatase PAP2 family protein n=2 Tax=Sphingobacterium TaxID=28453 RepID=UPI001601220C|nr:MULTISPECIES: phosphatase PAP2 family protein [unclassified Sphingobacterium]MBB1645452.1 PA-phosphatase [Sphingobacterium sp. UME9]